MQGNLIGIAAVVVIVIGVVYWLYTNKTLEKFTGSVSTEPSATPSATPGQDCGVLAPEELLPQNNAAAQAFDNAFPTGTNDLTSKNFLTAGYAVGIDTVSSSLKNASHDLRSTPIIPKVDIGPWMQSTITADLLRRPLEAGDAC
jgi:hypothetical protein